MLGNGIMQEIRGLLSSGKASGEVIALGYKPPTVYKVQRQLNQKGQGDGRAAAPGNAQLPTSTMDAKSESALEAENFRLRQEVETLEGQLECAVDGDAELAAQVQTLLERMKALEAEAAAAGQLRQRVKELEGQLEHAAHTQAAMRQNAVQWQGKFGEEQVARQKAEAQATTLWQDNQQLHGKLTEWQQWESTAQAAIQSLTNEVEGLRPLKVWAGHPCKICNKPLPGIVSREDAAKAMKDFGHADCLKQDSGPGGAIAAGLIGLYALSQMRKGA